MKRQVILALLLATSLALASCKVQQPQFGELQKLEFAQASPGRVAFDITIPIENPNRVAFKIKEVDLAVGMDGVELGKVNATNKIRILRRSETPFLFTLEVNLLELLFNSQKVLAAMADQDAKLEVKGFVVVGFLFLRKKIEIDQIKQMNLSRHEN